MEQSRFSQSHIVLSENESKSQSLRRQARQQNLTDQNLGEFFQQKGIYNIEEHIEQLNQDQINELLDECFKYWTVIFENMQQYLKDVIKKNQLVPELFYIYISTWKQNGGEINNWRQEELEQVCASYLAFEGAFKKKFPEIKKQIPEEVVEQVEQFQPLNMEPYQYIPQEFIGFEEQKSIPCRKATQSVLADIPNLSTVVLQSSQYEFFLDTQPVQWNVKRTSQNFLQFQKILRAFYPGLIIPMLKKKLLLQLHLQDHSELLQLFMNNIIEIPEIKASEHLQKFLFMEFNQYQKEESQWKSFQGYKQLSDLKFQKETIRIQRNSQTDKFIDVLFIHLDEFQQNLSQIRGIEKELRQHSEALAVKTQKAMTSIDRVLHISQIFTQSINDRVSIKIQPFYNFMQMIQRICNESRRKIQSLKEYKVMMEQFSNNSILNLQYLIMPLFKQIKNRNQFFKYIQSYDPKVSVINRVSFFASKFMNSPQISMKNLNKEFDQFSQELAYYDVKIIEESERIFSLVSNQFAIQGIQSNSSKAQAQIKESKNSSKALDQSNCQLQANNWLESSILSQQQCDQTKNEENQPQNQQ